ncbi:VCBS repeat-containing protein [Algoriphagus sanaruensis]|uniref:ASPIC/UnbV domain-containing protein n=1 Tax=Algoriphagus sanaruensis TaxID=1727163 RepID=A0A142EKU4_9BACT|nr:VCBS repeat-containing protein [Algoriphagus sanaruensis]AMQ55749.1 hypothetical protein AO498_04965 [Algoriphagus sanaruensis]
MKTRILLSLAWLTWLGCQPKEDQSDSLFSLVSSDYSGVDFRNDLVYTEQVNPYTFRNFYNGAGVAIGDINQDGLPDIFLAGNQTSNRLYLNQGNLKFKDITHDAGLNSSGIWSTGVSMADVNGDGLLDIYVCKSGPKGGERRHNELFINNGDLTFSEQSEKYGLAESGLSQHAVFFDYDKDGDLDMYLLSNSGRSVGVFDLRVGQREIRDPEGGNKLFRNDGTHFVDVSQEAGIYGSAIGYGLGVTVSDLNGDMWPDLYVSNDFFERDYLYLNNQDGTFKEVLPEVLPEISMGSMGADIADLDNDLRPDIFVTEMLPSDLARVKTKTPFEDWDKAQANFKSGYHRQFTRNTLQRNLGSQPGTKEPIFIEISRMTGMEATDWSWGALIFDADLDGNKDVFVANGIVKDLTDFDFVDFYANQQEDISGLKKDSLLVTRMIDAFPSVPQVNYLFANRGNWNFENIASKAGLDFPTFSTGAAYADLDNDGDLDLVINNLNEEAFLYQNKQRELKGSAYLTLDLGAEFGAKATVYSGGRTLFQEYQPVKGYMSSVDPRLHFGLGQSGAIDSLLVEWPSGNQTQLKNIPVNQTLKLKEEGATFANPSSLQDFEKALQKVEIALPFLHQESEFIDFDRDRLRFWSISDEGPKAALADVNGDGTTDVFIPGAKGKASRMYVQKGNDFVETNRNLFAQDSLSEDVVAHFFDADQDGDVDLWVGAGGVEFADYSLPFQDRLYLNDGSGAFSRSTQSFSLVPTSFVLTEDFDQDGDLDVFTGTRALPFGYGLPVGLIVYQNDGVGNFTDITSQWNTVFSKIGMLTSGAFADLNEDGRNELILAGEWMGIHVFSYERGQWIENSSAFGLDNTRGLWNSLLVQDLNGDGLPDILAGNRGLNFRLKTSLESQMALVVNDFDQNGALDPILAQRQNGKHIPWVMKNSLLRQIPSLKKQLVTYASYKDKALEELFPEAIWANSLILPLDRLQTSLWINQGKGHLVEEFLPSEVQSAPIYANALISKPGKSPLLIVGGNQSRIKPELGSQLGSYGWVLEAKNNSWQALLPEQSGLFVPGEIRDIQVIEIANQSNLLVLRNNDTPLLFAIR